jgi:hypothetical protein
MAKASSLSRLHCQEAKSLRETQPRNVQPNSTEAPRPVRERLTPRMKFDLTGGTSYTLDKDQIKRLIEQSDVARRLVTPSDRAIAASVMTAGGL